MTPGLLFLTPLANGQYGLIYPKFQIGIECAGKQMGQVRLEASEAIHTDPGSNQRRSVSTAPRSQAAAPSQERLVRNGLFEPTGGSRPFGGGI